MMGSGSASGVDPMLEGGPSSTSSSVSSLSGNPQHTLLRLCLIMTAVHMSRARLPANCKRLLTPKKLAELEESGQLDRILGSLHKYDSDVVGMQQNTRTRRNNHVKYHFQYTSRSLSVIGVLGGIVLILLLVALSSCIRNRRNVLLERESTEHGRFARQILIDHIRQVHNLGRRNATVSATDTATAAANGVRPDDTPPAYDDVVKAANEVDKAKQGQHHEDGGDDEQQPPSYVEAMQNMSDEVINVESDPSGPEAVDTTWHPLSRNQSALTDFSVVSEQQSKSSQDFTTTIHITS